MLFRVEEAKRNLKRPIEDRDRGYNDNERTRKRSNTDRHFGAPPPPRFESSIRCVVSGLASFDLH